VRVVMGMSVWRALRRKVVPIRGCVGSGGREGGQGGKEPCNLVREVAKLHQKCNPHTKEKVNIIYKMTNLLFFQCTSPTNPPSLPPSLRPSLSI